MTYLFFTPSLSEVKILISLLEIKYLKIFQAYRGVRTHHLRVSLTFPQRFSPRRPRGRWCWGGVSPQVYLVNGPDINQVNVLLKTFPELNPTWNWRDYWRDNTRGSNISRDPWWTLWIWKEQRWGGCWLLIMDHDRLFLIWRCMKQMPAWCWPINTVRILMPRTLRTSWGWYQSKTTATTSEWSSS